MVRKYDCAFPAQYSKHRNTHVTNLRLSALFINTIGHATAFHFTRSSVTIVYPDTLTQPLTTSCSSHGALLMAHSPVTLALTALCSPLHNGTIEV